MRSESWGARSKTHDLRQVGEVSNGFRLLTIQGQLAHHRQGPFPGLLVQG